MTDLHARLVAIIRENIVRSIGQQKTEREAALRIAELHAPACPCYMATWPCDTAKELLDCYVPGWRTK